MSYDNKLGIILGGVVVIFWDLKRKGKQEKVYTKNILTVGSKYFLNVRNTQTMVK